MLVNSLIKDLAMPARSVAHISVTNHAAHLIHLPYQIKLAMIDVHSKEWVCKAVRQPFFPKFLFIQNLDLTKTFIRKKIYAQKYFFKPFKVYICQEGGGGVLKTDVFRRRTLCFMIFTLIKHLCVHWLKS